MGGIDLDNYSQCEKEYKDVMTEINKLITEQDEEGTCKEKREFIEVQLSTLKDYIRLLKYQWPELNKISI